MTGAPAADRVLVIGESLIDIVEDRDGDSASHVGGSPLNVAVGLARLGVQTTFATEFGQDADGRAIADHLARAGVQTVQTADPGERSSTARARIGGDGSAEYAFDVTWRFDILPATATSSVVHVGSIGALRPPGGERVLRLVESLPADVLVTFDPNIRPTLLPDREQTRALVERYAERAAIVKLSDEDAAWLYPERPDDAPDRLRARGASVVVVTNGAAGSVIHSAAGRLQVPAFPAVVADTIGAGDAYMAGLIAAMVRSIGGAAAAAGRFDAGDLEDAGRIAAAAAGLTVSRAGAIPPTERELTLAAGVAWASS